MFFITSHQGDSNQNHTGISITLHQLEWPKLMRQETTSVGEDVEKGTLLHCWWECKLVQLFWKTVWRFLKKLKIELPYDPAIALLGIYPKDTDVVKRRAICTPVFIAAMATVTKLWEEPRCPSTDEWIKKIWSIYAMNIMPPSERRNTQLLYQHEWGWRRLCWVKWLLHHF